MKTLKTLKTALMATAVTAVATAMLPATRAFPGARRLCAAEAYTTTREDRPGFGGSLADVCPRARSSSRQDWLAQAEQAARSTR